MSTTETDLVCPICEYHMDLSSGVDHDEAPSDGAISICIRCATPSMFVDDYTAVNKLSLRSLTSDEWADIVTDLNIAKTRTGVLWVQSSRPR